MLTARISVNQTAFSSKKGIKIFEDGIRRLFLCNFSKTNKSQTL